MDNNLTICMSYFQAKHCFIQHTIPYNRGKNNISLLIIDPLGCLIYDCEIKGYIQNRMSEPKFTTICRQLNDGLRELKIQSLVGHFLLEHYELKKTIITTDFVYRDYWVKRFKEQAIDVLFIPQLISELSEMSFETCQLQTDAILNVIKHR